jgi:hypothetical protein
MIVVFMLDVHDEELDDYSIQNIIYTGARLCQMICLSFTGVNHYQHFFNLNDY